MEHIKSPNPIPVTDLPVVFLGGSIEQGKAVDWQSQVANGLADIECVLLNPRRDAWDATWAQDPTPGTNFHGQVAWELDGQARADICVYVFDPSTMSPVTMLEVGLYVRDKLIYVCCPKGFWRYGNIKQTFDTYAIPGSVFVEDLPTLIEKLHSTLETY